MLRNPYLTTSLAPPPLPTHPITFLLLPFLWPMHIGFLVLPVLASVYGKALHGALARTVPGLEGCWGSNGAGSCCSTTRIGTLRAPWRRPSSVAAPTDGSPALARGERARSARTSFHVSRGAWPPCIPTPDTPCLSYIPTLTPQTIPMYVNIPYMECLGTAFWTHLDPFWLCVDGLWIAKKPPQETRISLAFPFMCLATLASPTPGNRPTEDQNLYIYNICVSTSLSSCLVNALIFHVSIYKSFSFYLREVSFYLRGGLGGSL